MIGDPGHDLVQAAIDRQWYDAGHAAGSLEKSAAPAASVYALAGRFVVSKSGWGMLSVPNALVRGLFDALHVEGAELHLREGTLNAHISVFKPSEIEDLGGPDRIDERGRVFHYQIGPIQAVDPAGWEGVSKVWFVRVASPELQALRKSYGLSPLLNGHDFHITVAKRKTSVMRSNGVSKAAADLSAAASPAGTPAVRDLVRQIGLLRQGGAGAAPEEEEPDGPGVAARVLADPSLVHLAARAGNSLASAL